MNCLESRRALLAEPRRRIDALDQHVASCYACARLKEELVQLDRDIATAGCVRAPDALAERILLTRSHGPLRQYAVAAALVIVSATAVAGGSHLTQLVFPSDTVTAVGPAHPAIAAISEVSEDTFRPIQSTAQHSGDVDQALKRLGLMVKKGEASAHYVGKCHVAQSDCDHIVLGIQDAQANVMVVPDHPLGGRLIVADRRMVALVNSAGTGGYIVVADSPRTARRIEKLLVKG